VGQELWVAWAMGAWGRSDGLLVYPVGRLVVLHDMVHNTQVPSEGVQDWRPHKQRILSVVLHDIVHEVPEPQHRPRVATTQRLCTWVGGTCLGTQVHQRRGRRSESVALTTPAVTGTRTRRALT
jgi:hypothetical protein